MTHWAFKNMNMYSTEYEIISLVGFYNSSQVKIPLPTFPLAGCENPTLIFKLGHLHL